MILLDLVLCTWLEALLALQVNGTIVRCMSILSWAEANLLCVDAILSLSCHVSS